MRFEVWALGFDAEDFCTDAEELLGEYKTKLAAISRANEIHTAADIYSPDVAKDYLLPGDYFEIRVERVKTLPDGISENVETVFSKYVC